MWRSQGATTYVDKNFGVGEWWSNAIWNAKQDAKTHVRPQRSIAWSNNQLLFSFEIEGKRYSPGIPLFILAHIICKRRFSSRIPVLVLTHVKCWLKVSFVYVITFISYNLSWGIMHFLDGWKNNPECKSKKCKEKHFSNILCLLTMLVLYHL